MAGNNIILGDLLLKIGGKPSIRTSIDPWIREYAPKYGVTTKARLSAFIAQAAEETAGFTSLTEYTAKGYTRSGQQYEGRKDLGNIYSGDGAKFTGRGIFQITGRGNYASMSKRIFGDLRLLDHPELLATPQYAVLTAFMYWNDHNLNPLADVGDFVGITRKINGGTSRLAERQSYWKTALAFLAINPENFFADLLKKKTYNPLPTISNTGYNIFNTFRYFIYGR